MKRIVSSLVTIFLCLTCLLGVSALTDAEATQRKQAYYAGIDSTIQLLSEHLGNLTDATIERIVVTSLQDFTSEEAVKENVQGESGKLILSGYTVDVTIQFTAKSNETAQDYVFNHCLPAGTTYDLTPASNSNLTTYNYNNAVSYFSDYGKSIGNGIAKLDVLRTTYYLDIDLNDYKNNGYSLSLPYTRAQTISVPEPPIVEAEPSAYAGTTTEAEPKEIIPSESKKTTPEKAQPAPSTSASSKSSGSKSTAKVPAATAYKKVGLWVWIPTNGGKRYHNNSSCSKMINPRKVDLGEAKALGFTACGRCYR